MGIHRVLDSYDVTNGPATFLCVWSTSRFRDANPKTYKAYYDALVEAVDFINAHKQEAAQIYTEDEKGKESMDDVLKMLESPEVRVTQVPQNMMSYADTMVRLGTIKHKPASWKDFFWENVADKPGT